MPTRPPAPPRRPARGGVRVAAVAALALLAASCSGGGETGGNGAIPTLLTAPLQSTTTSTTTTTTTVPPTSAPDETATSTSRSPGTTAPPTSTIAVPGDGSGAATSAPDDSVQAATSGPSTPGTTAASTSTTLDIEPPPPSVASTAPVPTAAQPPDTIGGDPVDYVLGPRSIAGLQFGATRTTVLTRMRALLGDPLSVTERDECASGPAVAVQWFNASVIVTARGLSYYRVTMSPASYADRPVPAWRTTAGLAVGATRVQVDELYPAAVTYGTPTTSPPSTATPTSTPAVPITPFAVTAGADTGIGGQLRGDAVDWVAAGSTTC